MRTDRDRDGDLVITHRPVVVGAIAFPMTAVVLIYAVVMGAREGLSMDGVGWPLVAASILFFGGCAFARWWTVRFDRARREIVWRDAGLLRTRAGRIRWDDVAGVGLPLTRRAAGQSRRVERRRITLTLHTGGALELTHHTAATPAARARLTTIAALVRRELGLPVPADDAVLLDAVLAGPSRVEAARQVRVHLGVSLAEARRIVERVSAAADGPGETPIPADPGRPR